MVHPHFSELPALRQGIAEEARTHFGQGKVANYIPALAEVNPRQFGMVGMAIACVDGSTHAVGDAHTPFSLQSITKLFTFVLALKAEGDGLWKRVGREPSGAAFNSIVQLETETGIPRNPVINASALVITDILTSRCVQLDYALLLTCGAYDAAGDFAYRISLPVKTGVGGGIVAVIPEVGTVAVWSPELDAKGNSVLGAFALERLVALTGRGYSSILIYSKSSQIPVDLLEKIIDSYQIFSDDALNLSIHITIQCPLSPISSKPC